MKQGRVRIALLGVACALAVSACGSSSKSSSSTEATGTDASSVAHPQPIPGVTAPATAVPPAQASLAKLKKVATGAAVRAHLAGLGKIPLTQAVQEASGDINHFWSQEFASSGVQWPPMQDVIVDSAPVQTQCTGGRSTIAATDPWYLCDGQSGGTFYWTIPWMQQNIATDAGGVNLVFSMAMMWAFHIQNLFGFTNQMQQGQISKGQWAQQTVCLTGIYVKSLNDRRLFEQGDNQAVQSFLSALSNVNGIAEPDVSPQQLQQAFVAGFNSGQPSTCGISGGGNGGPQTTPTGPSPTPTPPNPSPTTPAPVSPLPGSTTS